MREETEHASRNKPGNESSPAHRADATSEPEELHREVERLRLARDEALAALARERELINDLMLRYPPEHLHPPEDPVAPDPGPAPLRYRLADRANDALKVLPGVHAAAKRIAETIVRAKSRLRK